MGKWANSPVRIPDPGTRTPGFFIVGAPRCGTTALSEYLGHHPKIFMAQPKEPHYFATDFPEICAVRSQDAYLRLFSDFGMKDNPKSEIRNPKSVVVGEASVSYLYSAVAVRNIRDFNPSAKLVAMLRNPVDMVYSLHGQLCYSCDEDERDFQRAWRLQAKRRRGESLPKRSRRAAFLQYAAVCRLGVQVQRLLETFPAPQVKLVLFDDFVADTRRCYEEILAFLNVEPVGRTAFPRLNEGKMSRFSRLARFTHRPPAPLSRIGRFIRRQTGIAPWDWVKRVNASTTSRPPLPLDFRMELVEVFRDDVSLLSQLLNRDLSHWGEARERVGEWAGEARERWRGL